VGQEEILPIVKYRSTIVPIRCGLCQITLASCYVIQVRYAVKLDTFLYGCASHLANISAAAVATGNCISNYHGYYADGVCEYCCLSNLCNRDKTSSWIKTDCAKLRSSASTVAVATAAVAMSMVTSWRLVMKAM